MSEQNAKDLKIQALLESLQEKENAIANLRVELTMAVNALHEANAKRSDSEATSEEVSGPTQEG